MSIPQNDGVFGFDPFAVENSQYNSLAFIIQQALMAVQTAIPVRVTAVETTSRTGPAGYVDVLPLVQMTTGDGQTISHTTVYHLPFFRLQGGTAGVICDPVVGDIGLAVICHRDISGVKRTAAEAPPGSYRTFSLADGFYFGGWRSTAAPTKVIILDANGCEIKANTQIVGTFDVDGTSRLQGTVNTLGVYQQNGTQVVGPRGAAVTPPVGGSVVDVQARQAINDLILRAQAHGLIS